MSSDYLPNIDMLSGHRRAHRQHFVAVRIVGEQRPRWLTGTRHAGHRGRRDDVEDVIGWQRFAARRRISRRFVLNVLERKYELKR